MSYAELFEFFNLYSFERNRQFSSFHILFHLRNYKFYGVTMAEEKYKVKTYEIDYKCDACGEGYMRSLGTVLLSNPVQYPHRCNKCGAEMNVRLHTYPYMVTERVKR